MALKDFLGDTAQIRIIDFLAENMDMEYNQTELSGCTGLSRTTIHKVLPELILNRIVRISNPEDRVKKYRLVENDAVKYLIGAALSHSFTAVESGPEDYDRIYKEIQPEMEETSNVFSKGKALEERFTSNKSGWSIKERKTGKGELIADGANTWLKKKNRKRSK